MTANSSLKRAGLALAALVALGVVALAAVPLLIPADAVREAVKAEIRAVTGLEPVLRGAVSVSLFPTGSVSFADVGLGSDQDGLPPLKAERLTARLQFFPLLTGQIKISDLALERPTIAVTLDAAGRSNWAHLAERLVQALAPSKDRTASFSEIRMSGGTLMIRDPARGMTETITDAELSLAWPSIAKSFAATGRFVWHDEPLDLGITVSDFQAALAGNRSGVKVRIAGAPLKLAFDGYLAARPTLKIEGTLAADTASLREALRWAGQKPLAGGGFGRFALKAQTIIVAGTIALSNVNVELDGNSAEGVLAYASDGRQTLQGTLATDSLDLTPYVSTFRVLTGRDHDWSRVPMSLDGLGGLDLDLRLSAARVQLSSAKLGRTAIATNLRNGKLTVAIGESQAFGGIIKGSFGIAKADSGGDLKADLQFADVGLESCLGQVFGMHRIEGRGNLNLALEGSGRSVLAVTQTLSGSATLTAHDGALVGINAEALLRRLERRPLGGGGDMRNGRTPFDKMTVQLKIAQGIASVENAVIEGPAVRVNLSGTASIPTRELDVTGTAALVASAAGGADNFELPFMVSGPWDEAVPMPDPQFLIRRSPAAAPLLERLGDQRTRSAVRSAIERLKGGSPAQPSAAAAPPAEVQPVGQAEPQPDHN